MTEIYAEISNLSSFFRNMCYGITQDEEAINDAVQELMIYFLQMNPQTLQDIYQKDGLKGIKGYGAVVLRRSLTSTRSPFYYKYKKYYTHIDTISSNLTYHYSFFDTGVEVVSEKSPFVIILAPKFNISLSLNRIVSITLSKDFDIAAAESAALLKGVSKS